jgi:predicted XRE-type DNA-binding protein
LSVAEGALAYWRMSQKYYSLTSAADQEAYLLGVMEPMLDVMTNHFQKGLVAQLVNRLKHAGQPIRITLGAG